AEEVAEKVPGTRQPGDVQDDAVEMDDEAEEVQVQPPERQVADGARRSGCSCAAGPGGTCSVRAGDDRQGDGLGDVAGEAGHRVSQRPRDGALGLETAVFGDEEFALYGAR